MEYLLSEVMLDLEFDLDNEGHGELLTILGFEDDEDETWICVKKIPTTCSCFHIFSVFSKSC